MFDLKTSIKNRKARKTTREERTGGEILKKIIIIRIKIVIKQKKLKNTVLFLYIRR